ncbi:DUF1353 domain-containing protein, partial [Salmonella enterica]
WMYDNALRTKKEADKIFLDGMMVLGVTKWKHTIMYWAVRLFGRDSYSGRNIMEKVCSQKKEPATGRA